MSNAKFTNALVRNLSILDGTGFDRKGYYAEKFLSALAEDGDLIEEVCEYNVELRSIIDAEVLIRPEVNMKNHPYMHAKRLVGYTDDWIDDNNRAFMEIELIRFLK